MVLRRAVAFTFLLIGLTGPAAPAWAQFLPPLQQLLPPMFRPLPPVGVEEEPPYDPPPGYGRQVQPGPGMRPRGDVAREDLPPPGFEPDPRYRGAPPNYGAAPPAVQPGYDTDPRYRGAPPNYGAAPPAAQPGYDTDPRYRGAPPNYGAAPPAAQPGYDADPRYRGAPPSYGAAPPPAGPQDAMRPPLSIEPDQNSITSALPPEVRPETGPAKELPPQFRKTTVDYRTREPAGTIIIDTPNTYLYLVLGNGKAMRYGIGVGREGFTWTGAEKISRMAEWPDWHPPVEMIERQPYLPRFMAGGPGNPLGSRALYLGKTLYRIHGTNQPSTIGTFVSSGCIRLTNEDVADLYYRVQVGTRVVVLPGSAPASASIAQPAAEGPYNPLAPTRQR
jgi:lipoprotein-anchoring transpeptidase ErfK/SrfK